MVVVLQRKKGKFENNKMTNKTSVKSSGSTETLQKIEQKKTKINKKQAKNWISVVLPHKKKKNEAGVPECRRIVFKVAKQTWIKPIHRQSQKSENTQKRMEQRSRASLPIFSEELKQFIFSVFC